MVSRNERTTLQEKLDKQRSLKWRQEMQRLENRPFDVSYCMNEEAITRERWKISHEVVISSSDYWTFVKANFPDDAREYGLEIINVNSVPELLRNHFKKNQLKILQSLHSPKFFHVRQSYITNDGKVYIFFDLVGHKNFLSKNLKNYPKESRELKAKMWGKAIADGLSYLHNLGIAFGHNLNIDNMVIDNRDAMKLFGLELFHCCYTTSGAKVLCEVTDPQSQYSAPEVVTGKHDEICSDIFRLGVIIYYLLTDSYPFNVSNDAKQLEKQIASKSWDNGKIANADCKNLLSTIFVVDPIMRITIDEIISHKWFKI